jgi:tetratricopeptide (TPR) repeat protein
MLSKPMLVTLPFVFLLLDYWPLGRLRFPAAWWRIRGRTVSRPLKILGEKVPLLAVSLVLSLVAYVSENKVGALLQDLPLGMRLAYVPIAYVRYLQQTVWPRGLTLFYPHPGYLSGAGVPVGAAFAAALLLLGVTAGALVASRRRPYLPVGWLWFLGTLVPVIGFVQVGAHFMADRYTYVPLTGLFLALAWAAADLTAAHPRWKRPALAFVLIVLALLSAAARVQIGYWRGDESLLRHAIAVTEGNWLAHNNLGVAFLKQGRIAEGVAELQACLEIYPWQPLARVNLGSALESTGRLEEAVEVYRRGLEQPGGPDPDILKRLGMAQARLGRLPEARKHLEAAIVIDPRMGDAHYSLGAVLMLEGRRTEAAAHFRRAALLDPNDYRARYYLGLTLLELGKPDEAAAALREAVSLRPDSEEARSLLEAALKAPSGEEGAAPSTPGRRGAARR